MEQLNKEQAIAFSESGKWKEMTLAERAKFQIHQDLLCMPFSVFHEAIEKTLDRPVWTHELGLNREGLIKELLADGPAPTFAEIVAMLPAEKTVVIEK